MIKNPMIRLAADLILLAAVFEGWWFIALPLALIGFWIFPYYVEFLVAGLAYDGLFGLTPGSGIFGYMGSIISFGSSLLIFLFRRVVR